MNWLSWVTWRLSVGKTPLQPPVSAVLWHLQNIIKSSSSAPALEIHRAQAPADLFINFPLVNSFSSVSQGQQTPPLIPTVPPLPAPTTSTHTHTQYIQPYFPEGWPLHTHGLFHSALRVGLSCGYTVPGLWLPLWPPSKCFSVARSHCKLHWWTHSWLWIILITTNNRSHLRRRMISLAALGMCLCLWPCAGVRVTSDAPQQDRSVICLMLITTEIRLLCFLHGSHFVRERICVVMKWLFENAPTSQMGEFLLFCIFVN